MKQPKCYVWRELSLKKYLIICRSQEVYSLMIKVLSNTVAKNPNKLKVFLNFLLKSEKTVHFKKDTLNEYGELFVVYEVWPLYFHSPDHSSGIYIPPSSYQHDFDEMKGYFESFYILSCLKSAVTSFLSNYLLL